MNTVSLAWRNLLRNRHRSVTTILTIVLGAVSILVFGGYIKNITYGMQTGFISTTGHLQIQRRGYFLRGSGNPAAYGITNYRKLIDRIERDPQIAAMATVVTPSLQLFGIAGNFEAGVSRTVMANGVIVEDQNRMRLWNDYDFPVTMPQMALTATADDAAVIGTGLARVLQLCSLLNVSNCQEPPAASDPGGANEPGDITALSALERTAPEAGTTQIEILASNVHGAPNTARLHVVKAELQGVKEFDDVFMAMHLREAQRLVYGSEDPQVTAIMVQLKHTRDIPAARARIERLLEDLHAKDDLEVLDFAVINPFYGQSVVMFDTIFTFISFLIGSLVLFMLSNTLRMSVVERTTEIGTLRAIGLRRGGIRWLFVCEGLMLGCIGSLVGVVVAFVVASAITNSGLTWTPPTYSRRFPIVVTFWRESRLILGTITALVLVAALSAWIPAQRASKLNIVDALRHV